MNQQSQPSVELLKQIDAACDRFEEGWRAGELPRIEEFLNSFRIEDRPQALQALQGLQNELILCSLPDSPNPISAPTPKFTSAPTKMDVPERVAKAASIRPQPDSSRPYVQFTVIEGPHEGAGFAFDSHDTLLAGRLAKAHLRLEKDRHFSRHHFRMEINPPECFLMDLGSRNGTYVNGVKVQEQFLRDGDIVSGGYTKMRVKIHQPVTAIVNSEATMVPNSIRPGLPQANPGLTADHLALARQIATKKSQPASPPSIPGYQLLDKIGAGDLGEVYQARRISSGEICALKILSPTVHNDESSIQSFLREARVLNQLNHPHIIRFLDMGAAGKQVYFATEFLKIISWEELTERFDAAKRIRVACGVMGQVLAALDYAHSRSLVHRDVKPGNILIARNEQTLVAKLADFGLAKQYTTAGMSQITRMGDVLGSLAYMSPDQFMNSRDARPTCDIYSAGATLYWMLTGREPLRLEGRSCKFLAILEDEPTPIRDWNPEISDQLATVVHRALEKTPEKRFSSAAEMRHHLKSATPR